MSLKGAASRFADIGLANRRSADVLDSARKVYSFRVFDTVLTRSVTPPSVVFYQVAHRTRHLVGDRLEASQFAVLRRQAEERVVLWHGERGQLEDIYRELQVTLHISADTAARIMEVELAVEKEVIYAVPEMRAAIRRLRSQQSAVVFVSDSYLPASYIRDRLVEHDIWRSGDQLFVSCEYGLAKDKGHHSRIAAQEMQNTAEVSIHTGSSYRSDGLGACEAGTTPIHFTPTTPNRYENKLEQYVDRTGGLTGLMAGASRYARLQTEASSRHEEALRDVAAGVMAPVLTAFVLWILQQADEQGIERLYFTARDGDILLAIARQVAPILGIKCELRYLYLSRVAVVAAMPDADTVSRTWEDFEEPGGEELMRRLGIDMEDIAEYLPSKEAREHIKSRPITSYGRELLLNVISRISTDKDQIGAIKENRSLLCDYLEGEGFNEKVPSGFVDAGWKGTVHGLLNDLLLAEEMIAEPLPGFFFDEYRRLGYDGDVLPKRAICTVIEMFCTANHGTVTGFQENGVNVQPTLESTWPDRMTSWGLPVVRRTVDMFTEGLTQNDLLLCSVGDLRDVLADLLRMFWMDPLPAEAEAWGKFPREMGQGDELHVKPLAKPYHWTALMHFARQGDRAPYDINHELCWPNGSLVVSSPWLRRGIQAILAGRRIARHLVRRVISS